MLDEEDRSVVFLDENESCLGVDDIRGVGLLDNVIDRVLAGAGDEPMDEVDLEDIGPIDVGLVIEVIAGGRDEPIDEEDLEDIDEDL